MAKRLATNYEFLKLQVTPVQMKHIIQYFEQESTPQVCVLDNGDTELSLQDKDQVIPLTFQSYGHRYVLEGSVMVKDLKLANMIRKTVTDYKGHAKVQRIYESFSMRYDYAYGIVIKIQEVRNNKIRLVYEFEDTLGDLRRLYEAQGVEDQIAWVKLQVDQLLEQRNKGEHLNDIDSALTKLAHELFVLEAT
ncbi:hypothetical protein BEP19_08315 [Ammoniphilus oxalaticus]|uniref:Non-ribosomal peptide synthetase module n=2 Tax=Ammoniphilus oxalaticus TaxID=66863 RepID=A0A419SL22_9BACL|nr:hypothetical protein BEP19_08315 [Ammoniphilus oxalaticus]